ncbi:MAG: hypothetical protein LCI00_12995 [Chloroflexi bacterium]|nr:hypothetical protein [Chloroflexota bacterium]
MNGDCTQLDWKPVLLVKVMRLPFGDIYTGLSVKRLYLAQHPDGILRADWTLPDDERFLPLVQLTGWKPERDVPFALPVQYWRSRSERSAAVIPSGTWVLPYDDAHYQLYERVRLTLHAVLEQVNQAPTDSRTLRTLTRWTM